MKASAALRIYQKKIQNAVVQGQHKAARELIQVIIDAIRTRTRLLRQLANGSQIPEFKTDPEGKSSYVKTRQRFSERLDDDTAPEISNATATGQMLNAMKGKAVGTQITIDLKTGRRKELTKTKSKLTNSEVNKYYEESKGEWFQLQPIEKEEAVSYAAEIIKQEILKVSK